MNSRLVRKLSTGDPTERSKQLGRALRTEVLVSEALERRSEGWMMCPDRKTEVGNACDSLKESSMRETF